MYKLYSIETGNFKLDVGGIFGVVPRLLWQKFVQPDENNMLNISMRCMLAVNNNRKILIDCGIGNKQEKKFFDRYYLNGEDTLEKSLQKHGFSASDITDVVLTHLHFDHCGGALLYDKRKKIVPTFSNADYWVSHAQWNSAIKPNLKEKASFLPENILPLAKTKRLRLIEESEIEDYVDLFPGFSVYFLNGHTLGQLIPMIQSAGNTVIFMADFIPTTAHLPFSYILSYDIHPLVSINEKIQFIKAAYEEQFVLFFEHDINTECCTIRKGKKHYEVDKSFLLSELYSS